MRLLVFFTALLLAPLAASAQVIHACVKNGGAIKIVADPVECAANDTPVSWNVQGPQGEPGRPGEPGPPGSTLRDLDGAGNVLGIQVDGAAGATGGSFFNEELGLSVSYETARNNFGPRSTVIFFELSECQGQAFIKAQQPPYYANFLIGPVLPDDPATQLPELFVTGTTLQTVERPHGSRYTPFVCQENTGTMTVYLLLEPFTGTLPFTIPVPEPIHVGLPPE